MRLIDADALTDFLKCLFPDRGMWEIEGDPVKDAVCETVVEAMEMVKNMETIRPEPTIVRCYECKHNPKREWFGCPMANLSEQQRPEDAWCWKGAVARNEGA